MLPWERQSICRGLLDVQQCEILAWGCSYHWKDQLKGSRRSLSLSTPKSPVWNDLENGVLVPLRFMEDTPDCPRCCCCSAVRCFLYFWLQQTVPFQGNILLLQEEVPKSESKLEGDQDRVYLDLTPVKSFLHCAGKKSCQPSPLSSPSLERAANNKAAAESPAETDHVAKEAEPCSKATETLEQVLS